MRDRDRWRKAKSLLRRVRAVPAGTLWLLGRAFFLLLGAKLALATMPVKRVLERRRRGLSGLSFAAEAERRREVRWAVLVVARYSPVEFVCFPQCLAASALLARAGVGSRLHYGVRRGVRGLETHTWLESGGEVVIGGEVAGEYSELEVF